MLELHKSLPKISCLLVTAGGRFEYLQQSFRCYCDQTYPSKELVVVTDAADDYKQQIEALTSSRKDVRLVFLNGIYTLGALRNISILMSTGEIFVQWDDDDFNMPDRLMIQAGHLIKSKQRICYFGDQLHYYFPTQQLFWENWWEYQSNYSVRYGLIPGTLMAYRHDFPVRYPSAGLFAKAGEDTVLSNAVCAATNQITLLKGFGHLQIYSFHGRNVWDIQHHLNISKNRSEDVGFMNNNRGVLSRTLDYMKFSPRVNVMGRDGLAFVHEGEANVS